MNEVQLYDQAAVDRLLTRDTFQISLYGRSAQDKIHNVSTMLTRMADVPNIQRSAQLTLSQALEPLTAKRETTFFKRLLGGAPKPLTTRELRDKVDEIITTLVRTEQTVLKNSRLLDMARTAADAAEEDILRKQANLLRLADVLSLDAPIRDNSDVARPSSADKVDTARRTAAEMNTSLQVVENLRLSIMVMQSDVEGLKLRTKLLLDEHVPLWEKLIDNMETLDAAAMERVRRAAEEAQALIEGKKDTQAVAETPEP